MRPWLWIPAIVALTACGPNAIGSEDGGETETGGEGFEDGRTLVATFEPAGRAPRVDMIVVVDDSPSMRAFNPSWAVNLGAFAAVLESEDVRADVRVAITSTSVAGPACPGGGGGEPLIDSCRAHLDDFVGPDEHGELGGASADLTEVCTDRCSFDAIPLVPSLGADDHVLDDLALRPWLEPPHNPSGGNLDGISLTEALTCAGLRGFTGCRFESPIEAAARMVERMADPNDPMAAFRRRDATLVILTLGDEDDCSHPDGSATIFDPGGERLFWPDPAAAEAVSAVCIRAGLACDDQGCALTDHALDGGVTDVPADAVLTPPTRLHDALVAAGEYEREGSEPLVTHIGGFRSNGDLVYTPAPPGLEPDEQVYVDGFGVMPGCTAPPSSGSTAPRRAGPGGRLAATSDEQVSICNADWTDALSSVAGGTLPQLPSSCMPFSCIADLEPATAQLEPDCVVEQVDWDGARQPLPMCERDENGWLVDAGGFAVPAGADGCWAWLSDPGGLSEDPYDDLSGECVDAGWGAELKIQRVAGALLPYDSVHELRCRPC